MNPKEDTEILSQIARLGHRDAVERECAATQIFVIGRERVQRATAAWFRNAELSGCFVMDDSGFAQTTVGVAVYPSKFAQIRAANGVRRLADVPPDMDAEEFELHFGEDVRLDVLTTRDVEGSGAIARFLSKRGDGIQQVELLVSDLDRATLILHARFGAAPIYPESRRGAGGARVNFFLVASATDDKLLIELVELPA